MGKRVTWGRESTGRLQDGVSRGAARRPPQLLGVSASFTLLVQPRQVSRGLGFTQPSDL